MSATVQSIDELVENFELLGDWESRFGYLIDLGKELPPLAAADQCEENRVHGCQAQVWLKFVPESDGRITIAADSDACIGKGLISVLLAGYSGKTAGEILAIDGEVELGRSHCFHVIGEMGKTCDNAEGLRMVAWATARGFCLRAATV